MAGLLSLPDELLGEIYIFAGQQTQTLVRLSAVNRRMREIWLHDADLIIAQVVRLYTPNHHEVIPLTRLEARCPLPTTGFHTLDDADQGPPLRLCLPSLMRNIALASEVCSRIQNCQRFGILLQHRPEESACDSATNKLEPMYYLLRRFPVAYHWPSLRPPLYAALQAMTDEALYCFTEICVRILCIEIGGTWPQRHLLHKPVEQYTKDDFTLFGSPNATSYHIADMWTFANHVGRRVKLNRTEGRTEEPGAEYHAFGGRKYDYFP
jgi:hypothetical protein